MALDRHREVYGFESLPIVGTFAGLHIIKTVLFVAS